MPLEHQRRRRRTFAFTFVLATGLAAACERGTGGAPALVIEPLPGATAFPPQLAARLAAAAGRHDPAVPPRTRHRRADGSPRYTNRLLLESSPYLLQHAHNPVDWHPWGDEAFAQARAEGKPLLVSIGYSTCHWCHVMEEESFDDEEIAARLNGRYVAVKVDREERPDVDETYMTAVLALTGNGGWPLTVWLTPDGRPFFGGTYFPARDGDRGVRTGFLTLLERLADAYREQPDQVAGQAAALAAEVRRLTAPTSGDSLPTAAVMHAAFGEYAARFDAEDGGFGGAPKFPPAGALDFLLRYHRRTGDARALTMATRTLEAMAGGGIRDQLGGGFHRYATDRAWRVPHFEKMLSDNAQLAVVYVDAYQVTKRADFAEVAGEILDDMASALGAPEGGFYTASDADSEGEEGRFFLWTPDEISAALDPATATAAAAYYGVTADGDLAGRSVLTASRPLAVVAAELGTEPPVLEAVLAGARSRLRAARATRVPPATDTKIVAAWNGLTISAFARAGLVLGRPALVERAGAAARFVVERMQPGGRLARSWTAGAPHGEGFLDDHAFLAAGLLDLYEASGEASWLEAAIALHEVLGARFRDSAEGAFFLTSETHAAPLVRVVPDDDGAVPSPNAVAAQNLLRIAELTGDERERREAEAIVRALAPTLARQPTSSPRLLAALDFLLDRPREVVVVHPAGQPPDARLLAAVHETYCPNRVLAVVAEGRELERQAALVPLLRDKRALNGASTAYVCERGVCDLPTSDPATVARQLAAARPFPDAASGRGP